MKPRFELKNGQHWNQHSGRAVDYITSHSLSQLCWGFFLWKWVIGQGPQKSPSRAAADREVISSKNAKRPSPCTPTGPHDDQSGMTDAIETGQLSRNSFWSSHPTPPHCLSSTGKSQLASSILEPAPASQGCGSDDQATISACPLGKDQGKPCLRWCPWWAWPREAGKHSSLLSVLSWATMC